MSSDELKISGLRRSFDNGPGGARDVKRIVGGGLQKTRLCNEHPGGRDVNWQTF